jgi:hypothetical protein
MMRKFMLLAALAVAAPVAAAGDFAGHAIYRPASADVTTFADGRTMTRSIENGFVYGEGAGNPFDKMIQNCYSIAMAKPGSDAVEQFGHCEGLDKDEDLFVLNFHGDTWTISGGTGKFAGMKGGGTTKVIQTWSDGSYLISWTGTTSK